MLECWDAIKQLSAISDQQLTAITLLLTAVFWILSPEA